MSEIKQYHNGQIKYTSGTLVMWIDTTDLEGFRKLLDHNLDTAAEIALINDLLSVIIKTHPSFKVFEEQLENGEIDRRGEVTGWGIFDPDERVRVAIRARDYLKEHHV